MLTLLLAAAMIPPPLEGDDRTAILESVNSLIDALTSSDGEAVEALIETDGSVIAVDMRIPRSPSQRTTSFDVLRTEMNREVPVMIEKLGIPTVMQRGPIAQVWVPYSFAREGKLTHCGMDAFTLVNRNDRWRTASIVYTLEKLENCAALGAPEIDR